MDKKRKETRKHRDRQRTIANGFVDTRKHRDRQRTIANGFVRGGFRGSPNGLTIRTYSNGSTHWGRRWAEEEEEEEVP